MANGTGYLHITASRITGEQLAAGHAELTEVEAWALGQLLKRISHSDCRLNAADDNEAYLMMDSLAKLQRMLSDVGIAPR